MNHFTKPRLTWNRVTQMWMVRHDANGHKLQEWMQKQFQPLVDVINRLNDAPAQKA